MSPIEPIEPIAVVWPSHPNPIFQNRPTDPELHQAIERLYHLQVKGRWLFNGTTGIVLIPFSLWHLRYELQLWHEYFTWAALRYGLAFNLLATVGLLIPLALTTATLIWQSRNLLVGLPAQEVRRLEQQVQQIRTVGQGHWLWRWVWQPEQSNGS
jgi:hypothetical protein